MKTNIWLCCCIITIVSLSGCSLKPVEPVAANSYVLDPAIPVIKGKATSLVLLVETPKASQPFNTTDMAYVDKPYQLAYFSYNQWADTPPQMLQPLLVQALQNTQQFQAVITNSNNAHYDLVLDTHLLQLQQNFLKHPSNTQLTVRAQLINNNTQKVIATKEFSITKPAPSDNPYGGVIAANQATAELLEQLTKFCLSVNKNNLRLS